MVRKRDDFEAIVEFDEHDRIRKRAQRHSADSVIGHSGHAAADVRERFD